MTTTVHQPPTREDDNSSRTGDLIVAFLAAIEAGDEPQVMAIRDEIRAGCIASALAEGDHDMVALYEAAWGVAA